MIIPVILAGGSGTRLWPLSRELYPKQFINLHGENSLLQNTILRIADLDSTDPIVICNEEHRFIVAEQLRNIQCNATIILEKEGRDTAAAITIAALAAQRLYKQIDSQLLVLSADHHIDSEDSFVEAILCASEQVKNNKLVTFGTPPSKAHIGYGYIKQGLCIEENRVFDVENFTEKPNKQLAQKYIESGDYLWNCGIFMFKANTILQEIKDYHPEILNYCMQALSKVNFDFEHDFIHLDHKSFALCESKSIDYAVIEQTNKSIVVLLNSPWKDIGCWSSLWEISDKDKLGNVCQGNTLLQDTKNSLVRSDYRLVATIGLENIIVVETHDAILVAHKDKEQEIKTLVNQLKGQNSSEYRHHREVYRPWGKYDSIDSGKRYQVKHITVKPGEKLSVQKHLHRAEHWTVVKGTAHVLNGNEEILLTENQSTYIPIGTVHSLENKGKITLEIIEVQSGAYLGEDDIIRVEDVYGRVQQETELSANFTKSTKKC